MRNIVLAALLTFCAAAASATDLNVYVKNPSGAGLQGVRVFAIHFSSNGPDGITQSTVTDATGLAAFSAAGGNPLLQNNNFDIFAATQGYLPGLRDQYNDPTHPSIFAGNTNISTPTVTLSSFSVTGVGEVDVDIANASPNGLVFGSLNPMGGGDPIAFGIAQINGAGAGRLTIYDAPFSGAGTLNASAYDPAKNRGAGQPINQDINATTPSVYLTGGNSIDFNGVAALPPSHTASQTQQGGGASVGGLSVDGVVMDTNSVNTIPWVGISLQGQYVMNGSTFTDQRWANSDQGGRFQLYGLMAGVTYYVTTYSGCDFNGNCYVGSPSANAPTMMCGNNCPAPSGNDFIYPSTTTTLVRKIQLNMSAGGTGTMAVYVQDSNGNPIPQAGVNIYPDGMPWETSGACAGNQQRSNPGLANANLQATTGYALVTKLPSGNYIVGAWTQFNTNGQTNFNDGPDGKPCWQTNSCQCGTDDLRVTVDTNSVPNVKVFNSSGVQVGTAISSITITVQTGQTGAGWVQGTLTFPQGGIDLSNDPITITAQSNCMSFPCPPGNLAFFNSSSTGPTINYAIRLSTGANYWLWVQSNYWGRIRSGGGDSDNLVIPSTPPATVTLNMSFARAGRIVGHVYKPDGSLFQPSNSMNGASAWIEARGLTVDGGNGAQVAQDGSFTIGGVLPGDYGLRANGWGSGFTYANPVQQPTISVVPGKDAYVDFKLVKGVPLQVTLSTGAVPPIGFPNCAVVGRRLCAAETFTTLALPAGGLFDQTAINAILFHDDSLNRMAYIPDPNYSNDCSGQPTQPGFCVNRVPSPTSYDIYLMRSGDYEPETPTATTKPYFVIYGTTRNVVVNDQLANQSIFWSGSTITARVVDLTPPGMPQGTAAAQGSVSGSNIFRPGDFASLGGSLPNFIKYVPVVSLYDSSGSLRAAGMAVPTVACFNTPLTQGTTTQARLNWFKQAIANSDYNLFQTAFSGCPSGYDIRGVSTGTYTAIVTTPNYPPCQSSVNLTVPGSTATVSFNMDQCAGAGAVIAGVVTSTGGVAIPNAAVSVEADGYKTRNFATDASGAFSVYGLANGAYTLKVTASGFAPTRAVVNISAAGAFTQNFSLLTGGASISGTVYSAKVPFTQVYPGAQIVAYDDTVNINNPSADLPVYKTVTSSAGVYQIDNLPIGDVFKIYVKVPGKFVTYQATQTINGLRGGIDFTLQSKPLDVQVSGKPAPPNYEFTVDNPSDFKSGKVWVSTSSGASFNKATSTDVSNGFMKLPNNQLLLDLPLAQLVVNQDYTLHIEAVSLAGQTLIKEVIFGTGRKASAVQALDSALLGDDSDDGLGHRNNQALLDKSGSNPSAISIPAGALIPVSSAAVPAVQFSNTDVNASTVAAMVQNFGASTSAFVSGVYQITFSSLNYTTKGVDITLAYDKSNSNIADLAMYHYNTGTSKWEQVPGLQTIDPVKGTVTVKRLKSLASVLGLRPGHPLMAAVSNGTFVPSAAAQVLIPDDQGAFSIVRPSIVGQPYTGTELKIFNFPNPFNLSSKTVPIVNGPAGTTAVGTDGTVIKYELPPGVSGHAVIRIYTISGELVQTLDEGDKTGGTFNYTTWNGKNRSGVSVANGVYYGVLTIPGAKAKNGRFKMAVIK